jgi:hypothetical protein
MKERQKEANRSSASVRQCWQPYPRFCCLPPSLSARSAGRSWLSGCYPPSPSRLRCERTRWCKCGICRSHAISPPHTPCSPSPAQSPSRRHCCQRRCALTAPFHPLPEPRRAIGGSALCCRLASRERYHPRAPACCFAGRRSALRRAGSREVPLENRSSGGALPAYAPRIL